MSEHPERGHAPLQLKGNRVKNMNDFGGVAPHDVDWRISRAPLAASFTRLLTLTNAMPVFGKQTYVSTIYYKGKVGGWGGPIEK